MSKHADKPEKPAEPAAPASEATAADGGAPQATGKGPLRGARDLWQVPALLIGIGLIALAAFMKIDRSTPPDFPGALNSAVALMEQGEYERAADVLNTMLDEGVYGPETSEELKGRFSAACADVMYRFQKSRGISDPEKHQKVIEDYTRAERAHGLKLDEKQRGNLAGTLVELGRTADALGQIERLSSATPRRRELIRELVERSVADAGALDEKTTALIDEMRRDPSTTESDHIWATSRRAEAMIGGGELEPAIDLLLRELPLISDRSTPEAGELFFWLGTAYLEHGDTDLALAQFRRAEEALPGASRLSAMTQLGLAQLAHREGNLDEAMERYIRVEHSSRDPRVLMKVLLGEAAVEADRGRVEEAIELYERLVKELAAAPRASPAFREELARNLGERLDERLSRDDVDSALRLAEMLVDIARPGEPAPVVLYQLGTVHEAIAQREAARTADEVGADPADQAERHRAVRWHSASAAEAYLRYSRLARPTDSARADEAVWRAAEAFDRAGEQDRTVEIYQELAQSGGRDPRRLEAQFRLARAFQARGDFASAIREFEGVISAEPTSPEAYRSYVPLAQCYMLTSDPDAMERAEQKLTEIVSGRVFEPSAPEFRTGLMALADLHRKQGDYARGLERYNELAERYPETSGDAAVAFGAAECHRLLAGEIGVRLRSAMPLSERGELQAEREAHLRSALRGYESARAILDAVPDRELTAVQAAHLRSATFNRGDCAFDLADYDSAIRYYDSAAQRYSDEPSSLVAMVQIVNAYAALGRWREARTAHERARARLADLPDGALQSADLAMSREHWERWLETTILVDQGGPVAPAQQAPDRANAAQ